MRLSHLHDREIMAMLDGADHKTGRARTIALKHLKECNSCSARASEMVELYDQLGSVPVPELSANFTDRVMKKVRRMESSRWEQWELTLSMLAPVTAAACALLLLDVQGMFTKIVIWSASLTARGLSWISSFSWPTVEIPELESFDGLATSLLKYLTDNAEVSSLLATLVLIVLLLSLAELPVPLISRRSGR